MSISKRENNNPGTRLYQALWHLYNRPARPEPWTAGGNLPWHEPEFSERMLREHLSETHEAASRSETERLKQIEWLWGRMSLAPGQQLLDVTCGPGIYATEIARRGLAVTGLDFGPAAVAHARALAKTEGLADRCHFIEQDVRDLAKAGKQIGDRFDAALLLYGQLAVFPRSEAQQLLHDIAARLRPGAKLCVELLNQDRVDKRDSTWWFTDDTGLWGDRPFLHLGERFWDEAEQMSLERFQTIDLESGQLSVIHLCDQTYAISDMVAMMRAAGFRQVQTYPDWADLNLYDAKEWVIYLAEK